MSKQRISNLFNSQEALGNISPLTAIEKFSGARNGKIRADFYNDCQDIPDRAYNSISSILVSSHCKTSTLVYKHIDAAKRAVISVYSIRVNCFNLSNASNT